MIALLLWVAWKLVEPPPMETSVSASGSPAAPVRLASGDVKPETPPATSAAQASPSGDVPEARADPVDPVAASASERRLPRDPGPRSLSDRVVVAASESDATLVDDRLPEYAPSNEPLFGLRSVGSDTMSPFVVAWGEDLARVAPGFRLTVEARGSATAPPALMEGRAEIGPMAREMLPTERDAFREKLGREPRSVRVASQAIVVLVHPANPVQSLSLAEVDAIFGATRRRGCQEIRTWGDLGLTGDWADKPISLFGRNRASGAYGFFKEYALKKGDFRESVKERPGWASVAQGVSEDRYAIGYADLGGGSAGVRVVPLAATDTGTAYGPDAATVAAGDYPLARFLRVCFDAAPDSPRTASVREFLQLALSRSGQRCVARSGFIPLTATIADAERALLGD